MKKQKSQKGFTIAELLVVVAILAILLTFAAPAVIRAFVRMHLTSLDNSACTIFAAAQNRMTAMAGNGELETFADGVAAELPGGITPSDFGTESGYNKPQYLRYLDSKNDAHKEALKKLLPGGSIESKLAEHHYVVEYNYMTGAVYAVWYSDEDEDFTYTEIADQKRGFEERLGRSPLVGYYGGSGVDYAKVGQMPIPELTLTNAEELRLVIKIPDTPTHFDSGSIGLTITVSSMDGSRSKEIITKDNNVLLDQNAIKPGTLVLDTLKPSTYSCNSSIPPSNQMTGWTAGDSFKNWMSQFGGTQDPNAPVPGEDITVTVTTYYAGSDGKLYLPQSASVSTNSLFANVTENAAPETGYTAQIAYGRHLQNLRAKDPAGTTPKFASGENINVTKAVQTQAIDFAEKAPTTPGSPAADPIYYWAETYADSTAPAETPYRAFVPIADRMDYDGHSLPIRSLYSTGYGGLFGKVETGTEPVKWENVVLIDTKVNDDSTKGQVGALAGFVNSAAVTNCQVYLEKNTKPYAAGDPSEPKPQLQSKGACVGGLVGQMTGTSNTITDSFAATVISGNDQVGGLVGTASNLTVTRSYAACHLTATNATIARVAGLVGVFESSGSKTIKNSYAAGIIAGGKADVIPGYGSIAGLAGSQGGSAVTVQNSYAAVRYGVDITSPVYGTVQNPASGSSAYYVKQSGINYKENFGTQVSSKELSEMEKLPATGGDPTKNYLGGDWYNLPAEKAATPPTTEGVANPTYATFPYNQTEETQDLSTPYPYPQLLMRDADGQPIKNSSGDFLPMLHYGDWLESEEAGALLVYYEAYKNGSDSTYGFYALTVDGNNVTSVLNTLHAADATDGNTVIDDGYLLVSPAELPETTEYKIDGTTYSNAAPAAPGSPDPLKAADADLTKALTDALAAVADYAEYKNAYTFHTDDTPRNYYHTLELNGQAFYYNTHFACEAYTVPAGATAPTLTFGPQLAKPGADGKGTTDPTDSYANCVVVRSPRQLAFMAVYTNDAATASAAQGWTWHQLLNIDNEAYTGSSFTAGGTATTPTEHPGTKNNPQLPAVLAANGHYYGHNNSIQNLFLGSWTNTTGSSYAGLFGQLDSSAIVQDLTLDTVTVNSTGTDATGALVGLASGSATIENCTVVDGLVAATSASNTGALVGNAAGGTTITGCGAYVSNKDLYTTRTVTGGATVDGLIGMVGSSTTVNNCYAAVKVTGTTNVGGFAGQINGSKEMKDCYAGGYASGYLTTGTSYINVTATGDNGRAGGFVGNLMNYVQKKDNDGHLTFDKASSFKLTGTLYSTCSVSGKYTGLFAANVADCKVEYKDDPAAAAGTAIAGTLKAATVYGIGVAFDKDGNRTAPTNADTEKQYFAPATVILKQATNPVETTPYTCTGNYPYATGDTQATHHGDWPAFEGAFYWEKEAGVYQFSTCATLGDNIYSEDDLCTKHHPEDNTLSNEITGWGYGLFSNMSEPTNFSSYKDETSDAKDASTAFQQKYPAAKYVAMAWNSSGSSDYSFDELNITSNCARNFRLDFRFGNTVDVAIGTKAAALGTESNPYQIRTIQQLDNIPNDTDDYYVQFHDLYGQAPDGPYDNAQYTGNDNKKYAYNGASTFSGTYDGRLYRILELNIDCTVPDTASKAAGLFELTASATLKNIILYSPSGKAKIVAADKASAGGLVAQDSTKSTSPTLTRISNCVVAGYTIQVSGGGTVGVGGLVGSAARGLTIENCAAVNNIESDSIWAGGLVGKRNTSSDATLTFTNCYAGGSITLTGNGRSLGGIVGYRGPETKITCTNVYSYVKMTEIKKTSTGEDNTFSGIAPAYYRRTGATISKATTSFTNCYYWSGGLPTGVTPADGLVDEPTSTDGLIPCALSGLAGLDSTKFGGDADHTFVPAKNDAKTGLTDKNKTNPADPYPFPAVVRELNENGEPKGDCIHYGEWPLEFLVAYYERYADGDNNDLYGFYALERSADGSVVRTLVNTLKTGNSVAVTDGYAILCNTTPANKKFTLNDQTTEYTLPNGTTVTPGTANYIMYKLPDTAWKAVDAAAKEGKSYYQKLTMQENGQVLLLNNLFACEAVNGDYTTATNPSTLPTEAVAKPDLLEADETANNTYAGHIIIRTARQLANVGAMTAPDGAKAADYQQKTYDQLLGIDYKQYRKINDLGRGYEFTMGTSVSYKQPSLLLSTGTYDGHGYAIRNLFTGAVTITDKKEIYGGLVGYAQTGSTLKNITLINTKADVDIDALNLGIPNYNDWTLYLGALAGLTQGTVADCGAHVEADTNAGYPTAADAYKYTACVVYNSTNSECVNDHVGGLIGCAKGGTISSSYAAVPVIGHLRVGGFAGSMESCTVNNCYVGGHTVNGQYNYNGNEEVPNIISAVTLDGRSKAPYIGGFAGELTGQVTFAANSVSYTTASVGTSQNHKDGSGTMVSHTVGRFIGHGTEHVKQEGDNTAKAILYATGSGFQQSGFTVIDGYNSLTPVAESYLTNPAPSTAKVPGFVTVPYDTTLKDTDYPYQTNLDTHHGDWPKTLQSAGAPPVEDGPEAFDLACSCTVKCTADNIREYCPVCSADYTKCQAPDPAENDLTGGEPTPEPTAAPEATADPAATPVPETPPGPETTPEPEASPTPDATPEPSESNTTPAPAGDDTPEPTPTEGAPADPAAASGTTGEGGSPE